MMDHRLRSMETLQLDGGCAVFDFTNTVSTRKSVPCYDYLTSYDEFLAWAKKVQLLPETRLNKLQEVASQQIEKSHQLFLLVAEVRDVMFQLFSSIAQQKKVDLAIQARFNLLLSTALSHLSVEVKSNKITVTILREEPSLDEPLHALVKNAYDIVTTARLERIKECPSCGWLFLDETKNGRRRWCDMQVCGSNDKAKRYYHRKKKSKDPASTPEAGADEDSG